MRKLWEDHVTWTRVFLITPIAGLPDTERPTERLLQNQVDIGNAIKPFYGDEAGDQLTALLRDHIMHRRRGRRARPRRETRRRSNGAKRALVRQRRRDRRVPGRREPELGRRRRSSR